MRREIRWWLHLALAAALLASQARATDSDALDGTCPVCGTPVTVYRLRSTNSFGGQDRDLFTQAYGDQGFIVVTASCPKCLYTARSEDFLPAEKRRAQAPPGAAKAVSDGVKRAILEEHALQVPEGGRVDGKLVDWAKLDLAAQTATLREESDEELGWRSLEVAWAVRSGATFGAKVPDRYPPDVVALREKRESQDRKANPALVDLEAAKLLLGRLSKTPAAEKPLIAALAASLLRGHGEHGALLSALPRILACFPKAQAAAVEKDLRGSIALEQKYQRAAMERFEKALAGTAPLSKPESRAMLTYLVGETARRLGEEDKARSWLGKVAAVDGVPPFLVRYAKDQLETLAPVTK